MSEEKQPTTATAAPPAAKTPVPPAEPTLVVSSSPHFHATSTVDHIMVWVIIALLPTCLAGIYFFGLDALRVLLVTTFASIVIEYLAARAMKMRIDIADGSVSQAFMAFITSPSAIAPCTEAMSFWGMSFCGRMRMKQSAAK